MAQLFCMFKVLKFIEYIMIFIFFFITLGALTKTFMLVGFQTEAKLNWDWNSSSFYTKTMVWVCSQFERAGDLLVFFQILLLFLCFIASPRAAWTQSILLKVNEKSIMEFSKYKDFCLLQPALVCPNHPNKSV